MKWFVAIACIIFLSFLSIQSTRKPIKVVVFDFGSVIAKTDKKQLVHFLVSSLNIPEEKAIQAYDQLKEYTSEDKEKDEELFWKIWTKENKIHLPNQWFDRLIAAKLAAIKEIPGMISLVKQLQHQGYQTALLSNVRSSQAAIKKQLGYYQLFSPVQLSCDIGIRKPDPQAYEILLSKLHVPPQSVLFIDNRINNVEAAKDVGMDGIVFVDSNQLIQELKKREILISKL